MAEIISAFFMPPTETAHHDVILFDGVCNLCSASVQFVIKRDKKELYRFASLQSDVAQSLLRQHRFAANEMSSIVLIENDKVYTKSTAALKIAGKLSSLWWLLKVFLVIPPFLRNPVYEFIAAKRYKWFGKKDECWTPSPAMKNKFID